MTRAGALEVIRSAGAKGDQDLFLRTYVENRISYAVAIREYRAGVAWAKAVNALRKAP
jgi:hypothetical protein